MANFDAMSALLEDTPQPKIQKKSPFREEELDFIDERWESLPRKEQESGKITTKNSSKSTTMPTTKDTTILATNDSGKVSRMSWQTQPMEARRNFQYTLTDRQQELFKNAAAERNYLRNGRNGVVQPNASRFLQDLIDHSAWEAIEFINEMSLWEQFQNWRKGKVQ